MEYQGINFYKIVREDLTHHGFTYKLGLNIDNKKFDPTGSCNSGGMYFTDLDNLGSFFEYGVLVANIRIPKDAMVYKDPSGNKWKANRFIIDSFEPIDNYWIDQKFCMQAVRQDYYALQYVKEHILTPEFCMYAVKCDGIALQFIKKQTSDLCKRAVECNSYALRYVKKDMLTPELCMYAVGRNGLVLQFIEEQTPELCSVAIMQNYRALQYVKNQTSDLCKCAVECNSFALRYVKEHMLTPELCMQAVQQNGLALYYVKDQNQTPELCIKAFEQNPMAFRYIKERIPKMYIKLIMRYSFIIFVVISMIFFLRTYSKKS